MYCTCRRRCRLSHRSSLTDRRSSQQYRSCKSTLPLHHHHRYQQPCIHVLLWMEMIGGLLAIKRNNNNICESFGSHSKFVSRIVGNGDDGGDGRVDIRFRGYHYSGPCGSYGRGMFQSFSPQMAIHPSIDMYI